MKVKRENLELLAPAGNMQKLKTAIYFGADAVYLAGKKYGLRAFADNFSDDQLKGAVTLAHANGKKVYVTVNIFPQSDEVPAIADYCAFLESINVDGAIISDLGIFSAARRAAPHLELHVSTQANVTNGGAARTWADLGAKRIVLARELTIKQIADIRRELPDDIELEAFVHGAMCVAYSGRCLLSSYFTGRSGNNGECAQSCRWEYGIRDLSRGETLPMQEDERGTYILSSRDLCMLEHLGELADAGITSLKVEGRVKSEYYVAGVINAYRRGIDALCGGEKIADDLVREVYKINNRGYTTGFYMGDSGGDMGNHIQTATHTFAAVVLEGGDDSTVIEMRNRFKKGDVLEVLSPTDSFNKQITIEEMYTESGEKIEVADKVQQRIVLKTNVKLSPCDILRKPV